MFVILWEFEVKPGSEPAFERVYGSQGDWVRLFRSDPHYRMTHLLRDTSRPGIYCTMDFWDSEAAFQNFKSSHLEDYEKLDRATQELTVRERLIGTFHSDTCSTSSS
jgi:heme-degrading monooxygenase HmoA